MRGADRDANAKVAKVGEEVDFKDSRWIVLDVESRGTIIQPNRLLEKPITTEGKYIQVHFKVTNTTNKEDRILDLPKLFDSQGREFRQIDRQAIYVPRGTNAMGLEALPAGVVKEFYGIYEVPTEARGLKFQARALSAFGNKALVDLGL
jgi:hypothetical protein